MLQESLITNPKVPRISDEALLAEVQRAAADERRATTELIALLGELDARRLYLGQGCSSLFTFCTQVRHLSEHAACGRIEAARASRSYPIVLELLAEGALTLTAVGLLRQHLTPENHRNVLEAARHRSKREVEELIARLRPQPAAPSSIRKLPCDKPSATSFLLSVPLGPEANLPEGPATIAPTRPAPKSSTGRALAPERYKIQFTISAATHARFRQVQDLLRHSVPTGDPAEIFDRALTKLLEHLQRTKMATTDRPRAQETSPSKSRHIPAAVKREVWTAMVDGALLSERTDAARRQDFWSFTISSHLPAVARRPAGTSSFAAGPTTCTRQNCSSGPPSRRWSGRRGRCSGLAATRSRPSRRGWSEGPPAALSLVPPSIRFRLASGDRESRPTIITVSDLACWPEPDRATLPCRS